MIVDLSYYAIRASKDWWQTDILHTNILQYILGEYLYFYPNFTEVCF